ncbi:MAG TPA: hypothetical protein VFQ35_21580, partial [Polyangiaceae bacterium]|nr:hypothetical protein [Polyangiaceae bacterium]
SAKERDREIVEATLTTFEATLASGIRDRSWERQSESALASVFTSPALAGSRLGSINCVESLCKIVVQYDRQDHSDPMEVSERVLAPFNAAAFFHHSPSTNETYFYVARDGQPLPNLAPPAG